MPVRIEDYALIGDCETAALVSRDGSIDWLCWPRFDSDAVFAALLGSRDNGRWLIAPRREAYVTRRYRPRTLVLETHFETRDGAAVIIDFMPLRGRDRRIVRIVKGERGTVAFHTELVLRFGYGAVVPWVSRLEGGLLRAVAGPDMVVLYTPVAMRGENLTTVGEFAVSEGDSVPFVLAYGPSHLPPPETHNPESALTDTQGSWDEWSARCHGRGPLSGPVLRSLITLKALTYAPTGGMVAAPTTSLPEKLGGARNWDYRFCWLRDATLTLLALLNAGCLEEAGAFREWLLRAVAGSPEQVQIMYGIAGERRLIEWELPWLPGYENSAPVRVGNAAHSQLQLDVFGELMDANHQTRRSGLDTTESGWALQLAFLDYLEKLWHEPDEGIWEVRGGRRHFTYSKAMAWVAFDRSIRSAESFGLPGPVEHWREIRSQIHEEVCTRGFNTELQSFVQSYDSSELDASLLLLPCVGFLPIDDPRIANTVAAIERRLLNDGFVMRYQSGHVNDGLPEGEGVFLACSFWLADVYILQGRQKEAQHLFDRLVGLANDVGLLSEEYDPATGRMVGNFPQAFTHVALVNTALNLTRTKKPVHQRARTKNNDLAALPAPVA
jgi:GH15 family glucan-1,4-alpha-glucosidase